MKENQSEKKISRMFDEIAPTYDRLNRVLSLGIYKKWCKSFLNSHEGQLKDKEVLDICSGTGDITLELKKRGASVYSLDFSHNMLKVGKEKRAVDYPVTGDAMKIPCKDNSFDSIFVAYGIRNIENIELFFDEVYRVLKPGGEFLILELTRPRSRYVSFFYNIYLKYILPYIGKKISGNREAYEYLSDSILSFMDPFEIIKILGEKKFKDADLIFKTAGMATIFKSKK